MTTNYVSERSQTSERVKQVRFAGDKVQLAGQIDYPESSPPLGRGYPLLFILHHAGCNTRDTNAHYANVGLSCGYAVFRWDKRGTGGSGAGGRGSVTQDAVFAYRTALEQPGVDHNNVIILAQNESTIMVGDAYGLFARLQTPAGIILAGNMLNADAITALDTPVQILMGEKDWNDPETYAREAADTHNAAYEHGAEFFIADSAGRRLMVGDSNAFHFGAQRAMRDWLKKRCQISR